MPERIKERTMKHRKQTDKKAIAKEQTVSWISTTDVRIV